MAFKDFTASPAGGTIREPSQAIGAPAGAFWPSRELVRCPLLSGRSNEVTSGPASQRVSSASRRSTARAWRRLFLYLQPHRRRFVLITALTLTASVLAALQPLPMRVVADQVLQ